MFCFPPLIIINPSSFLVTRLAFVGVFISCHFHRLVPIPLRLHITDDGETDVSSQENIEWTSNS